MGALVWTGFIAFFIVSLVVGIRLIRLWTRTRELPELLIGIGVLGIGPVGFGAMVAGAALASSQPGASRVAFVVAALAVTAGVFAKCVFNWRVYHPRSEPVQWLIWGIGALLVSLLAHRALVSGFGVRDPDDPLQLLQSTVQIGALLWGSVESLRYWTLMRRRSRIGLADPVVTNRFFLWGLGAGAAGVGSGIGVVVSFATGATTLEIPWVVASSSAHGFVAAVAISLAFVPPERYLRWVRASDAANTAARAASA